MFTTEKKTFYLIPNKICKHSSISVDFIVSVYELFDNLLAIIHDMHEQDVMNT